MKNLLVTGYRAHELGIYNNKHEGIPYIRQAIKNRILLLAAEGLEWVLTPGQYGVDLWACEAVLELKLDYPELKCAIITAFQHQDEQWNEEKQHYFRDLTSKVDYFAAISKEGYLGPWQFSARDDLLLRKSEGILLVYDEDSGEASPRYIKRRALQKQHAEGYLYLQLGPEDIQLVADEMSTFQNVDSVD